MWALNKYMLGKAMREQGVRKQGARERRYSALFLMSSLVKGCSCLFLLFLVLFSGVASSASGAGGRVQAVQRL